MDGFGQIVGNAKFWAALLAFANVIVAYLFPDAPKEIVAAANALAGVVFGIVFGADAGAQIAEKRMSWGNDGE